MRNHRWVWVALVGGILVLAAVVQAAGTAKLLGKVVSGFVLLPGVEVSLSGPESRKATTDVGGTFSFATLPAGDYRLTAARAGFQTYSERIVLQEGESKEITIALLPAAPVTPADDNAKMATAASAPREEQKQPLRKTESPGASPATPSMEPPSATKGRAHSQNLDRPRGPSEHAPMPQAGSETLGTLGLSPGIAPPPARRTELAKSSDASNTEEYRNYGIRQWTMAKDDRLSTFSLDADTASYTIIRKKLNSGQLPPPAAVRVEEFVNYFHYDYPSPKEGPFAVALEAAPSPFEKNLHVLRIGFRAMDSAKSRKPLHLTFLIDTSGSMSGNGKIEIVKRALRFLVDRLELQDTVGLCTFSGVAREKLRPTGLKDRARIHEMIENLQAGGSTALGAGLELAYAQAAKNFKRGHENRVILLSDGDANVGATRHGDLVAQIQKYAKMGITLTAVGVGMGNYKDLKMEQLADKGNGNYFYFDSFEEARRVFGTNLLGTLQTVAKDVKVQVEFDPTAVKKYRLVGYENRELADRDFRNDQVDAGEIGSGHTVTALYELELADPAKSFATVRVRWKAPQGNRAQEVAFPIVNSDTKNIANMVKSRFEDTSPDFRRAVAAAALAENLRHSPFRESWTLAKAKELAQKALSRENAEEFELIKMIEMAARLMGV